MGELRCGSDIFELVVDNLESVQLTSAFEAARNPSEFGQGNRGISLRVAAS